MGLSRKWLVLWSLWAARLVRQPTVPVLVSNGWLQGSVAPAGTHNAYLNIPYATLKQRFQAPGPEPNWLGVYEAINENVRCRQTIQSGSKTTFGQDDCHILNVYTPLRYQDSFPLPVMVFIHGGSFFEGSSSTLAYGPEYLVTKDVILVTISYRLSVPGFLCLNIKEAPGNAGMKDQVAALKWVQRNIRAFGGDPDNVTIFGESAGAVSVSLHLISPMSKGLFHKAILQSGSSLADWAYQFRPVYTASLLAKTMGYTSGDPHELYNFLSKQTNEDLVVAKVPREDGNLLMSEILFSPCIEYNLDGVEPFLTEPPYLSFSQGNFSKVPMITGSNSLEGLILAVFENETTIAKAAIEKSMAKNLIFPTNQEREQVVDAFKKMYSINEGSSDELKIRFSMFSSDMYLTYPTLELSSIIANLSDKPVFNNLFSYEGKRNLFKKLFNILVSTEPGAMHGEDLLYIFSQYFVPSLFETKTIERVTTMWTNLAKYGNPTPAVTELLPVKWPPVDNVAPLALNISSDLNVIPMWYNSKLEYWREVYSKYRRL